MASFNFLLKKNLLIRELIKVFSDFKEFVSDQTDVYHWLREY